MTNWEKHLTNRLKDWEQTPEKHNWDSIDSKMDFEKLEETFKQSLEAKEINPQPHVWQSVEAKLPTTNLFVYKVGRWAAVAAAILLLFSTANLWWMEAKTGDKSQVKVNSEQRDFDNQNDRLKIVDLETTLVVEDKTNIEIDKSKFIANPKIDKSKQAIADIIADEDEFADSTLNLKLLHSILSPIKPLSEKTMTASLNDVPMDSEPIDDFQISIPLNVVDAEEAAVFLSNYEGKPKK